jgi:hypothetical protein
VQDYLFTGNATLLQDHYGLLKDVLEFYLDFVIEGPHGWLVTNPSISPENVYYLPNSTTMEAITMGPTFDNSLIWELVGYTLETMKILGTVDEAFTSKIETLRERLPPIQISYFGGVQEWIYDYKEASSLIHSCPQQRCTDNHADRSRPPSLLPSVRSLPGLKDYVCKRDLIQRGEEHANSKTKVPQQHSPTTRPC